MTIFTELTSKLFLAPTTLMLSNISISSLILLIIFATLLLYTINSRLSSKHQVVLSQKLGPINRKFNYYQVIYGAVLYFQFHKLLY